jgi:hypothetical protein
MIVELPMKAAGDPAENRQTLSRLQGRCLAMLSLLLTKEMF